jgi:hypothetical protein
MIVGSSHLRVGWIVGPLSNVSRRIGRRSSRSTAPDAGHPQERPLVTASRLAKSICGIRWTPDERRGRASQYYAWIVEGIDLFDALATHDVEVIEVFPTASWTRWHGKRGARSRAAWSQQGLAMLGLEDVPVRTNQDQRDAIAAAVTARQYAQGMTEAMGEIVVSVGLC